MEITERAIIKANKMLNEYEERQTIKYFILRYELCPSCSVDLVKKNSFWDFMTGYKSFYCPNCKKKYRVSID